MACPRGRPWTFDVNWFVLHRAENHRVVTLSPARCRTEQVHPGQEVLFLQNEVLFLPSEVLFLQKSHLLPPRIGLHNRQNSPSRCCFPKKCVCVCGSVRRLVATIHIASSG